MQGRLAFWIATFLVAVCAYPAMADGLKDLEEFVKTAKTGRASFTQTAGALIHKEATLEMIAAARVDKSRRPAPPRR